MIGRALYTILRSIPELTDIEVSPLRTYETLKMPSVTYLILSVDPTSIKKTVSPLDEVSFVIDIFSKDYGQTEILGAAVRTKFDRLCGIFSDIKFQSTEFAGESYGYDEGAEVYAVSFNFVSRVDKLYDAGTYDYSNLDYSALDYFVNV